jgi:hypothetical protein
MIAELPARDPNSGASQHYAEGSHISPFLPVQFAPTTVCIETVVPQNYQGPALFVFDDLRLCS